MLDELKCGKFGLRSDDARFVDVEVWRSGEFEVFDGQAGCLAVSLGDLVDDLNRLFVPPDRGQELGRLEHGANGESDDPEEDEERAEREEGVPPTHVGVTGAVRSGRG